MRNLAVFGAGQLGNQAKKLIEEKYSCEYKLIYFVDNDPIKQGSLVEGIPVISAQKLLQLYGKEIDCVATAMQKPYVIDDFLIQHKIMPIRINSTGIYNIIDENTSEKTERFCPICQKKSSYFDLFGVKPRQNALCPHCGSLERHRLLYIFLKEKTDFFTRQIEKMLHIAPEPCFETIFKNTIGSGYISADLYKPNAMVKMDIMDIKYENETFDIIYCSHVLEHVSDDRKAMKEFFRILKKDGFAILNLPIIRDKTYEDPSITKPEEREKAFGQSDHVRAYGFDYIDRLREAGFSVDIIHAKDFIKPSEIEKIGLARASSGIYFCTKIK